MFVVTDTYDAAPAEKIGLVYDSGVPAMHRRIKELEERNRFLERITVASLCTLQSVAPEAYIDLAQRLADER
jgi:hypothetical protein